MEDLKKLLREEIIKQAAIKADKIINGKENDTSKIRYLAELLDDICDM